LYTRYRLLTRARSAKLQRRTRQMIGVN